MVKKQRLRAENNQIMLEILKDCVLEWDKQRGVLYIHSNDGHTVVRICGLKRTTMTLAQGMIDITRPEHIMYVGDE